MPLRVFQEMIKLGASIKKRKRQRLSTKISAFQDLHVICGMNLESCHDAKEIAELINTVMQLEDKAKTCIRPQSKWSTWASALQERAHEQIARLTNLRQSLTKQCDAVASPGTDASKAPHRSLFSSHSSLQDVPNLQQQVDTAEKADACDFSEWLRGWTAATTEALPELQELEQVCW